MINAQTEYEKFFKHEIDEETKKKIARRKELGRKYYLRKMGRKNG